MQSRMTSFSIQQLKNIANIYGAEGSCRKIRLGGNHVQDKMTIRHLVDIKVRLSVIKSHS